MPLRLGGTSLSSHQLLLLKETRRLYILMMDGERRGEKQPPLSNINSTFFKSLSELSSLWTANSPMNSTMII
jgi:hypothetical protein